MNGQVLKVENVNATALWRRSQGDARDRIHVLEVEKVVIARAMESLVQRFIHTFTGPCQLRLVLQRVAQGHLYLRWRVPDRHGQQPYLDMTGAAGRILLQRFSADMQQLLLQYGRDVLSLNLAHSIRQSEWVRLRQFVADYESLNSIRGR